MAYRSWLRDVKNIADLGQHLVVLDWHKPEWDRRDQLREERWRELHLKALPEKVRGTR